MAVQKGESSSSEPLSKAKKTFGLHSVVVSVSVTKSNGRDTWISWISQASGLEDHPKPSKRIESANHMKPIA
jgi:hypothetical protein